MKRSITNTKQLAERLRLVLKKYGREYVVHAGACTGRCGISTCAKVKLLLAGETRRGV